MGKKEANTDISAIVSRLKAEVKEGVGEKTLTLTDISLKMTVALEEIRDSLIEEIEEAIQEDRDTEVECCPKCGNTLKKTQNNAGKKYIHTFRCLEAFKGRGLL